MHNTVQPNETFHESLNRQRSEEVTHIVEHMPTRFGLTVSSIVVLLMLLVLFFGWVIKYPDVLKGTITINNGQSPIKIVTNSSGRLQLFTDTGKTVKYDQYIAVIKNAANTSDIRLIDSLLKYIDIHHIDYKTHRHLLPENISVGDVNQNYFSFLSSLYQYLDYSNEDLYDKQRNILEKQLSAQKDLLTNSQKAYASENKKYRLNEGFYQRDSVLYIEHVVSKQEYEQQKLVLVNSKQEYESLEKDITNNKYQLEDVQSKLDQLKIQDVDKIHELQITMYNNYYQLKEAIHEWERKYVLAAPFTGKVEFLNFWKNDDYVEAGKEIFSLIPIKKSIIGQLLLPEQGAGKVQIGQDVIVKLDDYPYTQFGSIKGKVTNISLIANDQLIQNNQKTSNYLVTVSFPNSLLTNYGSSLNSRYQFKGSAEIITDKRRLIERLFDNLKHSTR